MRHPHSHHEKHHFEAHLEQALAHEGRWRHHPGDDEQRGERGDRERGERGERRGRGRRGFGGPGGPGPWGAFGPGGMSGAGGHGGPGFRQGPPPWVAGLFGADLDGRGFGGPGGRGEGRRGPRVRRGDVRTAILDVLREAAAAEEDVNGYQVIQRIAERSGEQWKPSPGSVYPTVQQLQDEGLVAVDESRRRALTLTAEGQAYVADHADELTAVWAPFEATEPEDGPRQGDLRPEIGQLMAAVWQIASAGSASQRQVAAEILADTRRRLYGILADGDASQSDQTRTDESGADES